MHESLRHLAQHYQPRIHPERLGHEILDWEDQESQYRRFDVLLGRVSLTGKSLLDLGCGVGDLCSYLASAGTRVDYTGVDILGPMVDEARRRCPCGRFVRADLLREDPFGGERFHVAFCSGMFNLETGDNENLLRSYLRRLRDLTTETVVVSLLSISSGDQRDRYHYFDPSVVLRWADEFYPSTEVVTGYLANDFAILCRHQGGSTP